YDPAERLTATVDVGTNGGSAYTRPASVPARSDTVLVTSMTYNTAGEVDTVTDPLGLVSKTFYDNLGRTTKTITAYSGNGTPTDSTNKTTEYTYDSSGHLLTLTARLPNNQFQTTRYVYGVTTAGGSDVNSNDLLAATQYPDPVTGQPSAAEQETLTVDAL